MLDQWRAWLQLVRITNLPSAIANTWVGFLLTNQGWQPLHVFLLLTAATACIYSAGMILNDWRDVERDRLERPERPLPSGTISLDAARITGWVFLLVGLVFAVAAGFSGNSSGTIFRPTCIASVLIVAVVLYDITLKQTPLGPLLMGLCRGLNVMMGGSTGEIATDGILGFPVTIWAVALALTTWIAGLTWFARDEAVAPRRSTLLLGGAMMVGGLCIYGAMVFCPAIVSETSSGRRAMLFPLLVAAISFPNLRRAATAIANPTPRTVQIAVITALRSLIVMDASICVLASRGDLTYAFVVLTLLPISLLLGWLSKPT